jgi:hypothetical protein
VQVGAADSARTDLEKNVTGRECRLRHVLDTQWTLRDIGGRNQSSGFHNFPPFIVLSQKSPGALDRFFQPFSAI